MEHVLSAGTDSALEVEFGIPFRLRRPGLGSVLIDIDI